MRIRLLVGLAGLAIVTAGCLPSLDGSNTGPATGNQTETCDQTDIIVNGTHTITTSGTSFSNMHVVDNLCVQGGTLVIDADFVRIDNAQLVAAPPGDYAGVYIEAGHHGIQITDSFIDCNGEDVGADVGSAGFKAETGDKTGDPGLSGYYVEFVRNEIRDCEEGIVLTSHSYFGHNLIHHPDNSGELHADGVQWSTEDDGVTGISHTVFEWNRIHFPAASAGFQFHNDVGPDPTVEEWPVDIVVRYNAIEGGAYVVRFPGRGGCDIEDCSGVGLKFYGNRLANVDESEFGLCDGNTDSIEVWGSETGNPNDSWPAPPDQPDGVKDDENIDADSGPFAILTRGCDGIN